MSTSVANQAGPDLTLGVPIDAFADTAMLVGHVGEEAVLLARRGEFFFAIGAFCSHYHAALADGVLVGDTVRCPWHHACFSLRTGEALQAPAFSPVDCWATEVRDGKVFVRTRTKPPVTKAGGTGRQRGELPGRIVIVGGGAAGFAAAEQLRRADYQGSLVMLSDEAAAPIDRPNLSKDYLAGTAPEEWLPLRPPDFYTSNGIDLRLGTKVERIDVAAHSVVLDDGGRIPYDRLLLATGAEPVRLPLPGMDRPQVRTLRSYADCHAIVDLAASARRAVVMGASFIGLEVAAALRARNVEVHVVAPEATPMERVLGRPMGDFVRRLHEEHGVIFHLEDTATAVEGKRVYLRSGGALDADLVVVGVGVRPRLTLAEQAGLAVERGVLVNAYLETSAPGIFAAGDIARWPDPHTGEAIRVEHWVVAQRQGQTAALNMLGAEKKYTAVPFFWSQHYDVPINYVGHAENWDELSVNGDIAARDCLLSFRRQGRTLAVASIGRDVASLRAELEMEDALV